MERLQTQHIIHTFGDDAALGLKRLRRPRRPTISLLSGVTFLLGIILGVLGCGLYANHWLESHPDFWHPEKVGVCASQVLQIGEALESYKMVKGEYPRSQYELVPNYLTELPTCPVAGRVTYRTSFYEDHCVVECCGTSHKDGGVAPNNPRYDVLQGLQIEKEW